MKPAIEDLLVEARSRLRAAPFAPSTREAMLLLGHVLGLSEAQILARGTQRPGPTAVDRFRGLLDRRLTGEPIAYILGTREFYGRAFAVDSRVLIPRPETEHLIEAALDLELPEQPTILDIGTGSGCIAITLVLELAEARAVATDRSPGALEVARANAAALGVTDRLTLVRSDLAEGLDLTAFDLVISNPPYVDPGVRGELSPEVTDHEPEDAVFAPGTGDSVLERLASELRGLQPGTPVLFEIGYDQRQRIEELGARGTLRLREVRDDLAGHPRVALLASA